MAHWKLKIEKQFADEIVSGMKNFEIRCESDKVFQKGDSVEFLVNPVDLRYPPKEDHPLTGRIYDITYVLHGWGLREDYCAFAIRELAPGGVRLDSHTLDRIIEELPPSDREIEFTILKKIKERCANKKDCKGCWYYNTDEELPRSCLISGGVPEGWLIQTEDGTMPSVEE